MPIADQTWNAPIFPPADPAQPVSEHNPASKRAEITLFDHPVRHTKAGKPDAHARQIVERGGERISEVYFNRAYRLQWIGGTYAGTNGRASLTDSTGKALKTLALDKPGPFVLLLKKDAFTLPIGFQVVLEHLGDGYVNGDISINFQQTETEVS